MTRRGVTLVICGFDALLAAAILVTTLGRIAEPATHSYDLIAGYAVLFLVLLTAGPAAWMSWQRRLPRLALALSLVFPAAFALLFLAAVAVFA